MKLSNRRGMAGLLMVLATLLVAGTGCESSGGGGGSTLEGTWTLEGVTFNLLIPPQVHNLEGVNRLKLDSDGTVTTNRPDGDYIITKTGTWSATDTVVIFIFDGQSEEFSYVLDGDRLSLTDSVGKRWDFKRL